MPPGRLPREVFQACPTGRRPRGRPRTRWRDYVSRLAWERLGIPPEELEEVSGVREVWASLLRLLPPRPGPGLDQADENGWMDGNKYWFTNFCLFLSARLTSYLGGTGSLQRNKQVFPLILRLW
ncbi:hypothetical protein L3Q82_004487 [Scortum barcoo]|uniref:Uncharacterized protein n=1 Tax=Scortum barcoo TaxID=214431 RepID=A0ACB8VJT3_9TELE|nr:hypothetical protein L3Q82_004487 [Scortum barcoo]